MQYAFLAWRLLVLGTAFPSFRLPPLESRPEIRMVLDERFNKLFVVEAGNLDNNRSWLGIRSARRYSTS